MKKLTLISLLSTLSCTSFVHADCMGGGCTASALNGGVAIFALEGGYAKATIDGYNFTVLPSVGVVSSSASDQGYVFRISAGMMTAINDQFAVSGEMGWGYYGKTTLTPTINGVAIAPFYSGSFTSSYEVNGFDALAGLIYTLPSFNLYLKAGALIQNMKTTSNANFLAFNTGDRLTSTSNHTGVLPEVKVGGAYNFNENWALTLSYMYAAGTKQSVTGTFDADTGFSSLNVNSGNPSISAVMAGIQVSV